MPFLRTRLEVRRKVWSGRARSEVTVRLEASRPEWLTRPEGVSQALRRGARPEVEARLEVSMPEWLTMPEVLPDAVHKV